MVQTDMTPRCKICFTKLPDVPDLVECRGCYAMRIAGRAVFVAERNQRLNSHPSRRQGPQ